MYNIKYQLPTIYNQLVPTKYILNVYTTRNVCPSILCARVHHKKITPTDESHRLTVLFHHIEVITIFCGFAALFLANDLTTPFHEKPPHLNIIYNLLYYIIFSYGIINYFIHSILL